MKKRLFALLTFCLGICASSYAQTAMPAAASVMSKAYEQAAKENKKVLVIFHASWCGWCKKMEASINDPALKKMFDDNYVIAYLDVMEQPNKKELENPGALELMTRYKGEKSGLPFWFVADAKGNKLADSQKRPAGASLDTYGENVGCPAADDEVAYFTSILKATSSLKEDQLAIIAKRFSLNRPIATAH